MAMSTRSSGVPRSTARPVRGTSGVSARAAATDTGGRAATISLGRSFAAESGNYFLLLGTTLFLVLFGLVMVLSSSTIDSFNADQGFFGSFLRQGMYAVIGVPLMLIVSSVPSSFWKKRAWLIMGAAAVLQLLVVATPLGIEVYGNRNWIRLGPITAQPSELVKVGLVIWLAFILARKRHLLNSWPHVLIPIGPVAGGSIGLVLLGSDLGTVIILASIVVGALFFAGVPVRMLAIIVAAGAAGAILMTVISPNRMVRVLGFLNGTTDYEGSGWQASASRRPSGPGSPRPTTTTSSRSSARSSASSARSCCCSCSWSWRSRSSASSGPRTTCSRASWSARSWCGSSARPSSTSPSCCSCCRCSACRCH
jgi:cell division protein FtsW